MRTVQPQPVPEVIDGYDEHEVEQIMDMRTRTIQGQKTRQYLVHWKGYGHHENIWEKDDDLGNAQDLIKDYLGSLPIEQQLQSPTLLLTPGVGAAVLGGCGDPGLDEEVSYPTTPALPTRASALARDARAQRRAAGFAMQELHEEVVMGECAVIGTGAPREDLAAGHGRTYKIPGNEEHLFFADSTSESFPR